MTAARKRLAANPAIRLQREWRVLRDHYLPVRAKGSIWRQSRRHSHADPAQGWKLHVAATVVSACTVFRRIAPYLKRRNVPFKAPRSLEELSRLNAGITYGFSQVGKFVTVYPSSPAAALQLARALDQLTRGLPAPVVPYDRVLRPGSCVYYRYGAFRQRPRMRHRRRLVSALRRPDGSRVPDRREHGAAVPSWMDDPFQPSARAATSDASSPLETNYRDYQALVQRGRGGVYRARDISRRPSSDCIIKEGRRHGETDWHGRDGYYRIRNEARFLTALGKLADWVPRVRTTFRARGTFHLVMDHIGGQSLQTLIASRERISRRRTLAYCRDMSGIIADIHEAGWTWADCKPANFICAARGRLRALDFEGAFRITDPLPLKARTRGYVPPKHDVANPQFDDLFALGVCIEQLVLRSVRPRRQSSGSRRRGAWLKVPPELRQMTKQLLVRNPSSRPSARTVEQFLEVMIARERRDRPKASP